MDPRTGSLRLPFRVQRKNITCMYHFMRAQMSPGTSDRLGHVIFETQPAGNTVQAPPRHLIELTYAR